MNSLLMTKLALTMKELALTILVEQAVKGVGDVDVFEIGCAVEGVGVSRATSLLKGGCGAGGRGFGVCTQTHARMNSQHAVGQRACDGLGAGCADLFEQLTK